MGEGLFRPCTRRCRRRLETLLLLVVRKLGYTIRGSVYPRLPTTQGEEGTYTIGRGTLCGPRSVVEWGGTNDANTILSISNAQYLPTILHTTDRLRTPHSIFYPLSSHLTNASTEPQIARHYTLGSVCLSSSRLPPNVSPATWKKDSGLFQRPCPWAAYKLLSWMVGPSGLVSPAKSADRDLLRRQRVISLFTRPLMTRDWCYTVRMEHRMHVLTCLFGHAAALLLSLLLLVLTHLARAVLYSIAMSPSTAIVMRTDKEYTYPHCTCSKQRVRCMARNLERRFLITPSSFLFHSVFVSVFLSVFSHLSGNAPQKCMARLGNSCSRPIRT